MSHYQTIGILADADAETIKRAYRARAAKLHPDRNPGFEAEATAKLASLNAAYAVLSDPAKRAAYDRDLRTEPFAPASEPDPSRPEPGDHAALSPALERDISAGRDLLLGLVQLLAPERAQAAARAVEGAAHVARRYVATRPRRS